MAVVDTKYIAAGSYYSVVGYVSSSLPGTVSETSGGSQDNNLDDLYSGADMYSFYSTSAELNLYITDNSSNVVNSGWDFVKIGTASFNRTDATYTADFVSGRDRWRWTVTSNPFVNGTTYAISFETTSSGGGGGNYGFQQFDSSSDLMLDTSTAVTTLVKLDTITITLYKGQSPSDSENYNLTGVTSQQDLDDNYIFAQINGGFWSIVTAGGGGDSHTITYVSTGVIKFTISNNACYNFFGAPAACTSFDLIAETYDVYAIGKLL